MGLSHIASHAIWFAAVVAAAGLALNASFDGAEHVQAAREDRAELEAARADARFDDARFCWDGDKVRVMATNVGDRTIDALNVTIVVDGVAYTGFSPDVDGEAPAGNWHAGLPATFNKTGFATEPDRVAFFTAEGARAYAEKTTCPVLDSIVITPSAYGLDIGQSHAFSAAGYDQFGAIFDGAPYLFESDCGTVTAIDATSATFTAGTVSGACILTATSGAVVGSATITIDPDVPTSLVVTPDPVGVPAGGSQAFTATLRDQYGNVNTTTPVSWSTNAGSISVGGVLTAQTTAQMGRSVTATANALSDVVTVDVYAAAPSTITLSPTSATVNTTLTRQFTATVLDAYGNANTTAPVSWSATRGSVSASGLYTAPATTGADTVTATSGAIQGSAPISVQRAIHIDSLATYKANATATSFKRGTDTVEARAVLRDHLGNVVSGASVTVQWIRPNSNLDHTDVVTSATNGTARAYWVIPVGTSQGTWTASITAVSGTDLWWNTAANVATTVTFSVTN